jgi:hypothetical protein
MRRQFIGGYHGVPNTANIPSVSAGEPIEAVHIFKLGKEIERNRVNNVHGAFVKRTTGGTVIVPKRTHGLPQQWKVYNNGERIVIEIGHVYGSESEKAGQVDSSLFAGIRDVGVYGLATGYDLFTDIPDAKVHSGEPWSISFVPPSECHDHLVYLRLGERPSNKKDDDGEEIPDSDGSVNGIPEPEPDEDEDEDGEEGGDEEEDGGSAVKKPVDLVAFISIKPYASGPEQPRPNGVPLAVIEAIRDADAEPLTGGSDGEEACIGKKPFLYWNPIQIARSDVALERKTVKRHPFEVTIVDDGTIEIEQGFVYSYPHEFVDTGTFDYPNAVRLGESIAPETDGKEDEPVDPKKPDGTDKTEDEIKEEEASKAVVKQTKYLLNKNNAWFGEIEEGTLIYLKFVRESGCIGDYTLGWKCTIEIGSTMPASSLGGNYNIENLDACGTEYEKCGKATQETKTITIENTPSTAEGGVEGTPTTITIPLPLWQQWRSVKFTSFGTQCYLIAKIKDGKVMQMLRSDFFFYPPLDNSMTFATYSLQDPNPPEETELTPSDGSPIDPEDGGGDEPPILEDGGGTTGPDDPDGTGEGGGSWGGGGAGEL